jgi:hypothetical protein
VRASDRSVTVDESTADDVDVTGQPLYDGTFSTEAVAAAGHALVEQLHQEAMAAIAALAENGYEPAAEDQPPLAGQDDESTAWSDPESWSAEDEDDEEESIRLLQRFELPSLLPRSRPAVADLAALVPSPRAAEVVDDADASASAVTDEFAVVTADDREFVAV